MPCQRTRGYDRLADSDCSLQGAEDDDDDLSFVSYPIPVQLARLFSRVARGRCRLHPANFTSLRPRKVGAIRNPRAMLVSRPLRPDSVPGGAELMLRWGRGEGGGSQEGVHES